MRNLFALMFAAILAGCGGGSGGAGAGATAAGTFTFTVGGTVTGLSGKLVLRDNNGDDLTITNSDATSSKNFTFSTLVPGGNAYSVTVYTQPTGQNCTVSAGTGNVTNSNVNGVIVTCTTNTYNIGGTASGLTSAMVLQDNNSDDLTVVAADHQFTFATKVAYGSPYNVSVLTPPTGEVCTVSSGKGTVPASDVNVIVVCSTQANKLKVTVTGLTTGTAVALLASNGESLTVGNGSFTFASMIAYGSTYGVTVLTQPTGQICSFASGSGIMSTSDVTVSITCVPAYTVGGTVSLLNGSMVLQNNATDNLTVSNNGQFIFPTAIASGGLYSVSVLTQPTNQRCLVANGSGTNVTANVGNVSLSCASQMGGAMQGVALNLAPTVGTLASGVSASDITSDGTNLYVADYQNNMIRKIEIATGVVSTLAGTGAAGAQDGAGETATFNAPYGITTDGTNLYVADEFNNKIRKIMIATGAVSSLTGATNTIGATGAADGAGATATFDYPVGITTDGANLYVTDFLNNKIRKIVIATGVVSSLTGATNTTIAPGAADGTGATATFYSPEGITTDGTNLYVVDTYNNKIRKIVIATGAVSSLTGATNTASAIGAADGAGATATFYFPYGITTDGTNLYVVDEFNNKIRKIVIATGVVSSLTGATATFNYPYGITTDGTNLYVADTGNSKIRKIQ
jgi:sugar lactone lactonase YvrE